MSLAITQLSCFNSIVNDRRFNQLHTRSYPQITNFRPGKVLNVMSSDERGTEVSNLESKATSYKDDTSSSHNGNSFKSYPGVEGPHITEQTKKAAKIHDFCFGIPYGGIVLSGGFVGFILSRNPGALGTSVVFGGALLALSTLSLKVWRQGQSSLPFILGQAVLSAVLLLKNFKAYSLTQKLFPTGLNVVISGAMLCFYCYVVISGGNPPPKKAKSATAIS